MIRDLVIFAIGVAVGFGIGWLGFYGALKIMVKELGR